MDNNKGLNQYLQNKHKGGLSNLKGGRYEDFYAVYKIALSLCEYGTDLNTVFFQSQLKNDYVDDFLIVYPNLNVYHQLKNTKSVSWGDSNKEGTISNDFVHQIEICEERKELFELKLVYSSASNKNVKEIPTEIVNRSDAELFLYYDDISKMILANNDFRNAMMGISAEKNIPNDRLEHIATLILGIWKGFDQTDRVSLSDIVNQAKEQKYVNLSVYPDLEISEECKNVLDNISNIDYYVKGRLFYWSCGFLQGTRPWDNNIETSIIENKPTTKLELLSIL